MPAPQVPTNLQPVHNSTQTTSNFGVACALQINPLQQQAQWQISNNSSFPGTPRTVTTDFHNPGSVSLRVGTPRIPQGQWFIRCRAIDSQGSVSAWSPANTFTIFHPATGLPRIPANGASIAWAGGVPNFTWDFFDTSDLDTQTAYEIRVSVSPEDSTYTNLSVLYPNYTSVVGAFPTYQVMRAPPSISIIADSFKVPGTTVRTAPLTLPASARNRAVRWTIQTWDNDDASAGQSAPNIIFIGDLPVVTVTSPVGTVSISNPLITWSYASAIGSPQSNYQVIIRDNITQEVLHSSPVISSSAQSYNPPGPVFQNQRQARITVTVTAANGQVGTGSAVVMPQWITPPSPSFDLDRSFYDTSGFVDIDWQDAAAAPAFVSWNVYRRDDINASWVTLASTSDKFWRDFVAPPISTVEYAVTQSAIVQGEVTESSLIPQQIDLTSAIYLLTVEGQEGIAVRLYNVTADDFSKQYEESVMDIVGLGRKAEVGSTWGVKGTLTLQLRDSSAVGEASDYWKLLQEIKDQHKVCALRIPFGKVFRVHLGDLNVSRIAGTTSEIMDVTVDYTEVR